MRVLLAVLLAMSAILPILRMESRAEASAGDCSASTLSVSPPSPVQVGTALSIVANVSCAPATPIRARIEVRWPSGQNLGGTSDKYFNGSGSITNTWPTVGRQPGTYAIKLVVIHDAQGSILHETSTPYMLVSSSSSPSPSPNPTATLSPTPSLTQAPISTPQPTPSATPVVTPAPSPTPSPTHRPTPTPEPRFTLTVNGHRVLTGERIISVDGIEVRVGFPPQDNVWRSPQEVTLSLAKWPGERSTGKWTGDCKTIGNGCKLLVNGDKQVFVEIIDLPTVWATLWIEDAVGTRSIAKHEPGNGGYFIGGGSVVFDPSPQSEGRYPVNQVVIISISEDQRTNFIGWSRDCQHATGYSCQVVMDGTRYSFGATPSTVAGILFKGASRPGSGGSTPIDLPAQAGDAQEIQNLVTEIQKAVAKLKHPTLGNLAGYVYPYERIRDNFTFQQDLEYGSTGEDALFLQIFLNQSGFKVAGSGFGSLGQETTFFGLLTLDAVKRFQQKYASDILVSTGLTDETGYFGARSRAKVNQLLQEERVKRDEANQPTLNTSEFGEANLTRIIDRFNRSVIIPVLGQFFVGANGLEGFKPAEGIDIDALSGDVYHAAVQIDYVSRHPGATAELGIPNSSKSADLVSNLLVTPVNPGELWEIKPITHQGNPSYVSTDLAQMNGYLRAFGGRYVAGTSYQRTEPIPFGTFDLVVQQGPPGLIYYSPQNRTPSPESVPNFTSMPSISPETGWRLMVISAGTGGLFAVWWTAKLFAPVCGPAVLACVVVF